MLLGEEILHLTLYLKRPPQRYSLLGDVFRSRAKESTLCTMVVDRVKCAAKKPIYTIPRCPLFSAAPSLNILEISLRSDQLLIGVFQASDSFLPGMSRNNTVSPASRTVRPAPDLVSLPSGLSDQSVPSFPFT